MTEEQKCLEWLKHRRDNMPMAGAKRMFGIAISAPEKQEQTNTQCVNPMHTSRPNALKSLNILESAKDENGCIPMSLVRLAFRNVLEQDRWIPVTERLPEDYSDVLVWFEYFRYGSYNRLYQTYGIGNYSAEYGTWTVNHETGWQDLRVFAWKPLPEPYTEEEDE